MNLQIGGGEKRHSEEWRSQGRTLPTNKLSANWPENHPTPLRASSNTLEIASIYTPHHPITWMNIKTKEIKDGQFVSE
jgi:hypothetical protein